jgi:hypothetical protein
MIPLGLYMIKGDNVYVPLPTSAGLELEWKTDV